MSMSLTKLRNEEVQEEDSTEELQEEQEEVSQSAKRQRTENGSRTVQDSTSTAAEQRFNLGPKKKARVYKFNKTTLVDIREFYVSNGRQLPGKKGIALTVDQWNALKEAMPLIDEAVAQLK
eukprot:GILJ01013247.1.p1 GENE.GILJ01013247.1~~GILJ01013247.1.p1  ORF type:complete len:129 (+),score=21.77 GILJ01013247.1:27-389(+)